MRSSSEIGVEFRNARAELRECLRRGGADRENDGVGRDSFPVRQRHAARAAILGFDGSGSLAGRRATAKRREFLEQDADERRQVDPAFAGIEDRALRRDRARVDARGRGGNALGLEEARVIPDVPLVDEYARDGVGLVVCVPGEAAVEPQPGGVGSAGRERSVAVDADHAKLMVMRAPQAGRIEPGQRSA